MLSRLILISFFLPSSIAFARTCAYVFTFNNPLCARDLFSFPSIGSSFRLYASACTFLPLSCASDHLFFIFLPLPSSLGVLTRVSVAICRMRALEFSEHGVVGFVAEIFQCLWWMYVYAGFLLVVLLALVLLTAAFGQTLSAR
jgi:hypothetical protein